MWAVRISILLACAGASLAQQAHTYTPADVEDGGRLFRNTCAVCHGPDGDQVPGIDLGHLKFRRAANDDDAIRMIRNGIPGTSMPPHNNLSEFQAGSIIAYLRSVATEAGNKNSISGDAARGKLLFEGKAGCRNCHRVQGEGARSGPDLSEIGSLRRTAEIEQSILDPDAEIAPQNRPFHVVTKSGETVDGKLLNQDTFTLQVFDAHEQLRSFSKTELREYAFVDKSPMPSYRGRLSGQELADIVSYLATLKSPERPAPARR
ncbi:MAG: c-type cytochrome [Acidobacteriia bacterium]|nr:c-type cytochrome [Terriglobia bacterium]